MEDKTPLCVADSGAVSSGGLHCNWVGCLTQHAVVAAPHVSHAARFLSWLFG